ncbi:hypothetical protein GCM10009530_63940 [Microbispora corallina]|uniref:DUF4082 domain-containing protein n=1 Tax=Microbispora corallina TaxID=83302 RepID=A0ABQ4GCE3_9ACTN|nr:hypothetical protein [Microbispora corallina]GIH44723.1 hypothetical protein Mco01_77230 [Microbispora corallina]
MTNRSLGTYSYSTSLTTSFSFTFTNTPQTGSRIVVALCTGTSSLVQSSVTAAGWSVDVLAEGNHGAYILSKIATGSETGISWSTAAATTSNFAVAYERDAAPDVLFAEWDTETGGQLSATVTVPAGASNPFVIALVTAGSTTASPPSWANGNGLANVYDAFAGNSNAIEAFFATATTLPSAGSATYSTGTTYSGNVIPFVIAAYGTLVVNVDKSGTDAASLGESSSITSAVSRSDTFSLADSSQADPGTSAADAGAVAEQSALAVLSADGGALAEATSLAGALSGSVDAAALAEVAGIDENLGPVTGDIGHVGEQVGVGAGVAAVDQGALGEASGVDALWVLDGRWTADPPFIEWTASTPTVEWSASLPYL